MSTHYVRTLSRHRRRIVPAALVLAFGLAAAVIVAQPFATETHYHPLVGARIDKGADFDAESAENGGWAITRSYEVTLPLKQKTVSPTGGVDVVSYKTPQTNLAAYVRTMRPTDILAWHHEPEGVSDGFTAESYRAQFVKEYATAHQANPAIKFGMISGGFQWRTGNRAAAGGFLPPKGQVDWLGIDTYRTGASPKNLVAPLSEVAEFQNWYAIAKTYGVPLYITEYGRGNGTVPAAEALRPSVIYADFGYLSQEHFAGWVFWYPTKGYDAEPGDWRFTDPQSVTAMRWAARF